MIGQTNTQAINEIIKTELSSKIEEAPMDGNQYVRMNGAWSIAQMEIPIKEKCIITLASNQGESDAASLYGATVKVTDVDSEEVYYEGVWDGTEIALEFAPGVNYKIEVGSVTNYATPESKTLTALESNVRNVIMIYNTEVVEVNLIISSEISLSGKIVTINNKEYEYKGSVISSKVAFGTEYSVYVSGSVVPGFGSPLKQTFIASQSKRLLTLEYIKNEFGVFIQDTESNLWATQDWDGSKTPNCIAVITEEHSFGISLTGSTNRRSFSMGGHIPISSSMKLISSESEAIVNYDGKGETEAILSAVASGEYDAYGVQCCVDTIFPNGKNGYCPASGEWYIAMANRAKIDAALSKCGGLSFQQDTSTASHHCSTIYVDNINRQYRWFAELKTNTLSEFGSMGGKSFVRAFTSL